MNDSEFHQLRESSWLRTLSPEEKARLRAWLDEHPEAREPLEEDQALNAILEELPDVPVASNFTARVLQQAEAWQAERERRIRLNRTPWRRLLRWMPQAATGLVVLGFALGGYRVLREKQRHEALAPGVELVKHMATLPNPESLRDFNVIQSLSSVPHPVDFELLEALE